MARKTTGSSTPRRRKTDVPVSPASEQVKPVSQIEVRPAPVQPAPVQPAPVRNEKLANRPSGNGSSNVAATAPVHPAPVHPAPVNLAPVNLEEEIRRRAYELYLQRRATAGGDQGNQHQDWLIAEHEIRARYDLLAHHTTA